MSRLALKNKAKREPKFPSRQYNRCPCCGRVRGFLRRFRMCRICFRLPQSAWRYPRCDKVELVDVKVSDAVANNFEMGKY